MDQEAKAHDLMAKAEKKLGSWSLFGGLQKYEDAAELFTKAANQFKVLKKWYEAGEAFEKTAACCLKANSAHEAATAFQDSANCFKKIDAAKAVLLYKEAVAMQVDMGRFTTAAKLQKEVGELQEAEGNLEEAMGAFQTAADYYNGEESTSSANQCLLKVAGFAAQMQNYKKATEIYEQVAIVSLENTLLKWSVKSYLLTAGICVLATGDLDEAREKIEKYQGMDASFGGTREGKFLEDLYSCFDQLDGDAFTDKVREYDEISRLDSQKTTLLLEIKNKIKASQDDIT